MGAQHTPGPWRTVDVTHQGTMVYRRIDAGKRHVGFAGIYKSRNPGEADANARLVVEAPAMLEALRDSTQHLEEWLLWATENKTITRAERGAMNKRIAHNRAILARIDAQ